MSGARPPFLEVACNAVAGPVHFRVQETLSADWTVLFGPSGSGKSTLLRLIAGLWMPNGTSGEATIRLHGEDLSHVPAYRRGIALVAQQPALFPHRTARRNVVFGLEGKNNPPHSLQDVLQAFQLEALADRYPAQLSGGEQQRVALARAIAPAPRLLLLDEAFSGMHREQQQRLIGAVRTSSERLRMPVLSVTHDVGEAFLSGQEVLRIEAGRIIARGNASEVLTAERQAMAAALDLEP